ncbi:hypothetical protein RBB50_009707 [Rhinocladiella similis]
MLHPEQVVFNELRRLPRSSVPAVLDDVRKLERKTFAANEVFPFDDNIVGKHNMIILVALSNTAKPQDLVAYAVGVRWNHQLLLHKICVAPPHRCKGLGRRLLQMVIDRARSWSCRGIDLWVDEANQDARRLYTRHGFKDQEVVADYYSKGRNGVKMCRTLE